MEDDFYAIVGTEPNYSGLAKKRRPDYPAEGGVQYENPFHGNITIRRWARSDDRYWQASDTCDELDPGFYELQALPNIGPCLVRKTIATDGLIDIPDAAGAEVIEEFAAFWELKNRFEERGFLHKRGILLWGNPGSGKTTTLMLMARDIVRTHKGIVVQIDHPTIAAMCLTMIRKIEPNRQIVAIMENLDAQIDRHGEEGYLSLLDGETQVNNIVYIASTNYPERLDKRFVDRPSRFDTVRWIGMPSDAARRTYLHAKDPTISEHELREWVTRTKGFSIAHLRELVILVRCFGRSLDQSIDRLDKMRMQPPSSNDLPDRMPPGFATA